MTDATTAPKAKGKMSHRGPSAFRVLDAVCVVIGLIDVSVAALILAFHTIPDKQLPIFTALVTGPICGAFGLYLGSRFGNPSPVDTAVK